jgi:hypothetical protein
VTRPSSSTTRTTTASSATATIPSAANDLVAYFAAATDLDQRLKVAAAAANGAIGTNEITISQSTIDAINAADPLNREAPRHFKGRLGLNSRPAPRDRRRHPPAPSYER